MKHGYLIDMDGVLYRGHELIRGADTFIHELRVRGIPFRLLTNNSQRTRRDIATKLSRLGIEVEDGPNDLAAQRLRQLIGPAGLLWIKDLFTTQERQFDTVLRDSLDDALYVFKGTHFRKYDGRTRRLVEEGSDPRGSDWPGLWKDGRLDAAILAYYKQDARPGEQPKFGGRAIFFRPGEIMFHARRELPANKRAWAKALGDRCAELRDGVDAAVNVTADGSCGFLFKGTNYFRYTLEPYTWGPGEQFSAIEGPFPVAQDFPGLWTSDVALAYAGKPDCVLVFQRTGVDVQGSHLALAIAHEGSGKRQNLRALDVVESQVEYIEPVLALQIARVQTIHQLRVAYQHVQGLTGETVRASNTRSQPESRMLDHPARALKEHSGHNHQCGENERHAADKEPDVHGAP